MALNHYTLVFDDPCKTMNDYIGQMIDIDWDKMTFSVNGSGKPIGTVKLETT